MNSASRWTAPGLVVLAAVLWTAPRVTGAEAEYAPADAYLDGSRHPYYGSLNPWNLRFFGFGVGGAKHLELYGRRSQRQLLDILEGRLDEAVEYCEEVLAADPSDAESLFTLTVARCVQKNAVGAAAAMERALAAGLPFERFLAGPRELLGPLRSTEAFRRLRNGHQLLHGPLLGCVTSTSAKFWVRTADEVAFQVRVHAAEDSSRQILSPNASTQATADYTAVVEVEGLRPDTRYVYDVVVSGEGCLGQPLPSFRTFAASKGRFRVAFGGGALYAPSHERMWETIRARAVTALLLLGDNVYIDLPRPFEAFHRYTYYRRQSRPEFRRLTRSVPVYAIWDDHDCATDDVWMGPYRDRPAWKPSLVEGFRTNWNNPGYGDAAWPGCWFSFSIADVDFFMLDGRSYRTNPLAEPATMLGAAQKAWLLRQLKASRATFKVLASPVPWAYDSKRDSRDTWNGFRDEREEIFDFLHANSIDGVVLLAADRHRSEARRIERASGYALYEFESSRLTNEHKHGVEPGALFAYNEKQSFGLLSFDTTQAEPTVTFEIISIDNERVQGLTLSRREISAAAASREGADKQPRY